MLVADMRSIFIIHIKMERKARWLKQGFVNACVGWKQVCLHSVNYTYIRLKTKNVGPVILKLE